jgi:RNA polymerase-associated protein RTF1
MEESDSEADNDDDVPARSSEIPYPLEGKYIDTKDKARINSLPQLERERILGERAEELNKAQWAAELSRRAREKELQGTPDRKRKASSIEPDDSQRKSSRQKVRGKNDKLEEYKREREQRDQQRQRRDDGHRGRRRSISYDSRRGSDVDADGESEVEYTDYREKSREKVPAELNHFESVRVGRGFFANVCFDPGFEETMTGCYVRVGTGQDSQRRTLYKMAQIKGMYKAWTM